MIIVVGPLPPPVHGASLITERIKERLVTGNIPVIVCSTSARVGSRGFAYFRSRLAAYLRGCRAVLRHRHNADGGAAIYFSLSGGLGLIYDLALVMVGRLMRYDMIFHHHTFSYIASPSPFLRAIVKVAGRRQIHIALCTTMARRLEGIYGRSLSFHVVSNLAFMDSPQSPALMPIKPLSAIGYLSNISFAKGIDRYLDLVALLRAKGSRLKGLIAGPFEDGNVQKYVEQRLLQIGDIEYVGPVYSDEKTAFFSSIDLLVFPSRLNEAQPLVIFEAQAAGVPTAASEVGCITDIIGTVPELLFDLHAPDLTMLAEQILRWEKEPQGFYDLAQQVRRRFTDLVSQTGLESALFDHLASKYR
jgi:glycosyltransferase involved in cell wall biosynthesis